MKRNRIYLDYNATTPLNEEVIASITNALKYGWGNPSSSHENGDVARKMVSYARGEIAGSINANADEIVFTSGGTEANNWVIDTAIKHFSESNKTRKSSGEGAVKPHIIASTIEHDSIVLPLKQLEKNRLVEISWIPVDKTSLVVTPSSIVEHIKQNTCLVTVMMANNETGAVMPISDIFTAIKSSNHPNILLHTDAAQAIGKLPVDVKKLKTDYLTIVGHKFYGPRIGALYVRNLDKGSSPLYPLFFGGGQEHNYRPGTENTPMIVGLGKACSMACKNVKEYASNMEKTRNYLEENLKAKLKDKVMINCDAVERLPNTSSIAFVGTNLEGYNILKKLVAFCCSTGSACHSNVRKPSKVLLEFNIPPELAINTIRISTGRETTIEEIDTVVEELVSLVAT